MVLNLTGSFVDQNQHDLNHKSDSMSFLGTLSPPSSSMDSMDLTSPVSRPSPSQLLDNVEHCSIIEDYAFMEQKPFLKILEQPVEKFRFRYKSEMSGTHGSLTGVNSDKMRKCTYPTVQLYNYSGPAIIRCALYQINNTQPHPHRLVARIDSKDKEQDDPHDKDVSADLEYKAVFQGMGIIHTAKKNLVNELFNKKKVYFQEHKERNGHFKPLSKHEEAELRSQAEREAKNINLNTVRLGFEAFCRIDGALHRLCPPVYSNGINNLKSALTGELKIVRMDHTTTSCVGGQEIFMLVEKVVKNNIKIRFFQCDEDDIEIWSDYGRFSHIDVHHQYAIVFKAPPYRDQNIEDPVEVCVELVRPSDGARSEPRLFKYKPSERIGRKRLRYAESSLPSSELPATLNNLSFESSSSGSLNSSVLDQEFYRKEENINSEEFAKLCNEVLHDYQGLCDSDWKLETDGPQVQSRQDPRVDPEIPKLARKVVSELEALLKRETSRKDPEHIEKVVKKLFYELKTGQTGNNALHTAILCEQYCELQYILILLSKMKHLKIVDLKNKNDETALHLAVEIKNPTVISLLLQVGANPSHVNKDGNTPLHYAIELDALEVCQELITPETVNKENYNDYTPLHLAVLKKNQNYVKKLIARNANVNHKHRPSGNTILHIAIQEEYVDMVKYLLYDAGAQIDIANFNGDTPFQQAQMLSERSQKSAEIFNMLHEYIQQKGYVDLIIKNEPVSDDSSDSEILTIKSEPTSPEPELMDFENQLPGFLRFSPDCIDSLAKVLENTDALKRLSESLDFPLPVITTKIVFNYINVKELPILQIRDWLHSYGAKEAVNIINRYIYQAR